MRTKKHLAGVLAFLLLMTVGFTACNNDTPPADGEDGTQIEDAVDDDNDAGDMEDDNDGVEDVEDVEGEEDIQEDSMEDEDLDVEDEDN